MSQWRRIALEEVPACKKVIEESNSPASMWSGLYDELSALNSLDELLSGQIYAFAFRCFKSGKPEVLSSDVWVFFHYVVGGYIVGIENIREDLPKHISVSDFHYWAEALKDNFPPQRFAEATKHFHASKNDAE